MVFIRLRYRNHGRNSLGTWNILGTQISSSKDEIRMRKLMGCCSEGKEQGKGRPRFPTLKNSREIPSD